MHQPIFVRDLDRADLPSVRDVLASTDLFPTEILAEMAEPYLSGQAPHHWLVACSEEHVLGFAYAEPERMTNGTFNLLAIAVDPASQGQGIGKVIVRALEERLRRQAGRVLIVETSSLDDYASTRAFYASQSFTQEALIRHFYAEEEHKVLFWKHL